MNDFREVKFDKNAYHKEYTKEHYDRVVALVPKGTKEIIKERGKSCGLTMTQYLLMTMEFYEKYKGEHT